MCTVPSFFAPTCLKCHNSGNSFSSYPSEYRASEHLHPTKNTELIIPGDAVDRRKFGFLIMFYPNSSFSPQLNFNIIKQKSFQFVENQKVC